MPEEDPLLLPTDTGLTLHWRGLDFYPRAGPVEYARRKARVFSPLPRSLYYVPSLGLGHGLADLLARLPSDCSVLCVEAYQEIMGVAAAQAIPRDPRLVVVRTQDPEAAAAALRSMGTGRFRRVVETPLSAGYRLAPELYGRIRRRLEQEIMRFWQNRLTMIAMGNLQVRNLLSNLPLLGSALDFSALSTELPVVVAGAGPSLETSIPVLRRSRDSFTLLAVDTALPPLVSSGVIPDVVVALEAQAVNNKDFIGCIPPRSETILACDLSVHPSAARLFEGRVCFFSSEFAPLHIWQRLERSGLRPLAFPALGSVGVTAAHAALKITGKTVFLTGMDLSFPGWKTHASGSPMALAMMAASTRLQPVGQATYGALVDRRLMRVADKHGRTIITDRVLKSYRDSLEEELGLSSGRALDCGETGLPLGVSMISTGRFEELLQDGPLHGADVHDGFGADVHDGFGADVPDGFGADVRGGFIGPPGAPRLLLDRSKGFERSRIAGFLAAERELLLDCADAAAAGSRGAEHSRAAAGPARTLSSLLSEADYAWAHFPDVPDLSAPDRGFLARARVAALYYAERVRRIESVLEYPF